MLKKITAITLVLALTACANTDQTDENIASLTNMVDTLSAQVADLKTQQESTAADAQAAKDAAKDANARIDNVVASYKK
jgi:murein lipoprotein